MTVPTALFLFLSIFILVCIELVFKRMLRLFSLLIWACLVTMGYLFMFSGGILSPWDQVDTHHIYLCIYIIFHHKSPPTFSLARHSLNINVLTVSVPLTMTETALYAYLTSLNYVTVRA